MGKHDFKWLTPVEEHLSFDPPKDDFYKARIETLERENRTLNQKLETNAKLYGMSKDTINDALRELNDENVKLRERIMALEQALIREAIRDVQV